MRLDAGFNRLRIAICVPCRDMVHSMFTYHLVNLVYSSDQAKLKTNVFMQSGSLIANQRQKLAEKAILDGATHILWLDSDMTFPPSALETLLRHNLDVVACTYSTRSLPLKGVAYTSIGDWDSWVSVTSPGNRMVEVEGTGMGCMLVRTSTFKDLPKPWFEVSWSEQYQDHIGEDFYFCKVLRDNGHKILIDRQLSQEVGHLGTTLFDISRANTQP